MKRFLLLCLLPVLGAAPASADILNAGETLCVEFTVNPPFGPSNPDVMYLSFGIITVNSAFTTRSAELYDGTTLLGVHTESGFGGYVGPLSLSPTNTFTTASSVYTFINPAVVDFTSILDGSIQGRIEFSIQTGQIDLDLANVSLSFIKATSGSGGTVVSPAPTITSVSIGSGCGSSEPGTSFCFGDGTGSACPCGNTGGVGEGCANSTGSGGVLSASGSDGAVADDLVFSASGLVPGQPGLLFVGDNAVNGGAGNPFGDGLRCAGGSVVRLGVQVADAGGLSSWGPGLNAAAGGPWSPGDTRRFQGWYRDPVGSPCGSGFNLTGGYEVTFQ